MKTESP